MQMKGEVYYLTKDKKTFYRKLEGKRGDKVFIIYDSPPAAIVENEAGYRFAVNWEYLSKEKPEEIPQEQKSCVLNERAPRTKSYYTKSRKKK